MIDRSSYEPVEFAEAGQPPGGQSCRCGRGEEEKTSLGCEDVWRKQHLPAECSNLNLRTSEAKAFQRLVGCGVATLVILAALLPAVMVALRPTQLRF